MSSLSFSSKTPGRYRLREFDRSYPSDVEILDQNQSVISGTILGKVTAEGQTFAVAAGVAAAGNTGNATFALTGTGVGAGIQPGKYKTVFRDATHYSLLDPNGDEIAEGVLGAALVSQLKIQGTAGATPMVAGDEVDFTATATAPTNVGNVKAWDPTATDGSEKPIGISYGYATTGAGVTAPIDVDERVIEVDGKWLDYGTANAGQIAVCKAQLKALGIVVR